MTYSGVCKNISPLNHSCSPNTASKFDMASFSFRLFAVRDIAPGEELTYSYTDPTTPAAVRQKILEPYGFRCDCRACCEPYRSDMRRKTIRDAAVSPALMTVWNEEGLQVSPLYPQKVEALLEDCIFRGDADNALVYGQMLGKMHWLEADVRRWMTMASIKSHPMWK